MIWYRMISYGMMWYHTVSYHMKDIIWYDINHMISYHLISYRSRGRGCRRGRGLAMQTRQETCFRNFTLENDLQKINKILKRSARKFCTCSWLNHYKMFFLERVSTTVYFQGKLFFVSGLAIRAFTPQSGEPRTLKHYKNKYKMTYNFRSGVR